jgi:chromosomal replication initiation ATPase DnaA
MKPSDIPTARVAKLINQRWDREKSSSAKMAIIIKSVADACDIGWLEMVSRSNVPMFARPRMLSMSLCRRLTHRSGKDVSNFHGRKDPGTSLNAQEKMEAQTEAVIEQIEAKPEIYKR